MNSDQEKQVSELLSRCEVSFSSRNFEEAINNCRAVLAISPENVRAKELLEEAQSKIEAEMFVRDNLKRANEFFNQREFQKCVNECQKIHLIDPDNADAANLLSVAQEKLEAEPFVQNFITSGQSLFDSGLYSEAIAQWEKVAAIDPTYPGLDQRMKAARDKLDPSGDESSAPMFELSTETPEGTFDLSGGTPDFGSDVGLSDEARIDQLLQEGDRFYNNRQYQKAIEMWSEIFMLDVNHAGALERIENARKASGQQQNQLKEMLQSAQSAYEQGDMDQAERLFNEVKAIDPDNPDAERYLSMIVTAGSASGGLDDLLARGRAAEAQSLYREAAQYYSQALAIDAENGELADKIKNLNLLAKKQEQSRIQLSNARAFLSEGKVDSARHAVNKILETDPTNQEALSLLEEIKSAVAGGGDFAVSMPASSASASRPAVAAVKRKSFPVVPAAIVGLLIAIGAGAYFFLFGKEEPPPQVVAPVKKKPVVAPVKKTVDPVPPPAPVITVTPEMREKAGKLVQEANFYFTEKQYVLAIEKADEALKNDPENKDAQLIKANGEKIIADQKAAEEKLLNDAHGYFNFSEFAGAAKLYEQYLEKHPEQKAVVQPQIIKCYYNLGVLAIRQFKCNLAGDYFRQVLFIDETDKLSQDALTIARQCEKSGTSSLELRKSIALMELRK